MGSVETPGHFAFDADGGLLVQTGNLVRRIDEDGVITTIVGNGKAGLLTDGMLATDAPLPSLYAIAVDANGNIYIADGLTSVYRIDAKGILTLFAGAR